MDNKTKIYESKHLGFEVIAIESEKLLCKILKSQGAKLVSLFSKENEAEFIFQPSEKKYTIGDGKSFGTSDTSGADEMLPTIDECFYPGGNIHLPDHGCLWDKKWEIFKNEDSILCSIILEKIPLKFTRKIEIIKNKLSLTYGLENLGDKKLYYLWAFHGLMNFDNSSLLEFDDGRGIENVVDGKKYKFDYKKLGDYPDKESFKFYLKNPLENGEIKLIHPSKRCSLTYQFDTQINKYLGIWITKGGYKNEYNIGIEPASGYYDSLNRAYENNKISSIEAKEILKWNLDLIVESI